MTDKQPKPKLCDDCQHNKRLYADGYVYRDWSGLYSGLIGDLPTAPDPDKFWTYLECAKNNKGLKHINLDGKCVAYQVKK
jgi:hypothetical protein